MNRLPSSSIKGKCPYELMFSKVPSLSHLRVIGCLCHATIMSKRDKCSERARQSILMGYSTIQKEFLLLNCNANKFFVSRDVKFQEHVFPFANQTSQKCPSQTPSVEITEDAFSDDSLSVTEEHSQDTSVLIESVDIPSVADLLCETTPL